MTTNKLLLAGMTLVALASAPNLVRAEVYCSGSITGLILYDDGSVALRGSWRSDNAYTFMCSVTTTGVAAKLGVSTDTCKTWYGSLLTAKATGSDITLWYYDNAGFNCANLPTYGDSLHVTALMPFGA